MVSMNKASSANGKTAQPETIETDSLVNPIIHCYQGKKAKSYSSLTLTAIENTWCHQRRLRRQQRKIQQPIQDSSDTGHSSVQELQDSSNNTGCSMNNMEHTIGFKQIVLDVNGNGKRILNEANSIPSNGKKLKLNSRSEEIEEETPTTLQADLPSQHPQTSTKTVEAPEVLSDTSPKDYILKCVLRLKRSGEQVLLELEWLDGHSRELMHQVMTFLKNKLAQR